jgi:hypothetical protein
MELSSEDSLRLNVLIKQDLQAIRIDESKMIVHALTGRGEAKVALNPTCRDDKYLRMVREMFSTHALDSPGGYPVYLRRWTRMGEMREESLQGLLLLGEPEAIVAVANSPRLNEETARRAWWAMPEADIARRMLKNPHIATSDLGKELADFLVEFLPFETEAQNIVESVRLVLQPGLIDEATKLSLWSRANRKSAYYVGFLLAMPDALPDTQPANAKHESLCNKLKALSTNIFAKLLVKLLSAEGQTFLATIDNAISKLGDQQVTVLLLKAIQNYFRDVNSGANCGLREFSDINLAITKELDSGDNSELQVVVNVSTASRELLEALLRLAYVSESLVDPIFSQTDAVGSVMRKRLQPVTQPIHDAIQQLRK